MFLYSPQQLEGCYRAHDQPTNRKKTQLSRWDAQTIKDIQRFYTEFTQKNNKVINSWTSEWRQTEILKKNNKKRPLWEVMNRWCVNCAHPSASLNNQCRRTDPIKTGWRVWMDKKNNVKHLGHEGKGMKVPDCKLKCRRTRAGTCSCHW